MNPKRSIRLFTALALTSASLFSYAATSPLETPQWQESQISNKASFRGSDALGDYLWVSGSKNSVYLSTDKGKTWLDRSPTLEKQFDFRDIEVLDENTVIIMSAGSGDKSKLLKSSDAGKSWAVLYENTDEQGFFDAIDFWDNQQGLMLGDPVDGYYMVKKTTDGGKTWRRIAKTKLPAILEKEAAFAASGNTLIVGEQGRAYIVTGGFSASVYISNDWGESWQRQSVPLFSDTQTAGGYGLALNSQGHLFALGGDYTQRPAAYPNISVLSKNSWQQVNAGERGLRTAMSCQKALCIATGKTGNDISFDHGVNWSTFDSQSAEKGDKGFYTLASDNNVFVAAGANGKVAIYSMK